MPSPSYFDKPGLSFHQLKDFGVSPQFYYRKHVSKVLRDEDKPAYAFGRAVHCRTLEGLDEFAKRFVTVPPEFLTPTGLVSTSKEAKAWKAQQTAEVLSPSDADEIHAIAMACHAHPIAGKLLMKGQAEVERFGDLYGIETKGCADWICAIDGVPAVVDLKTCSDLDKFIEDAKSYGYARQMAWYMALFGVGAHALIAVEKKNSQRVGVFQFGQSSIIRAEAENREAVGNLLHCREQDVWPVGYTDGIITIYEGD